MKNQRNLHILFLIIIFIFLLFPIKTVVNEDGKIVKKYKAILYSILFWRKIGNDNYESKYWEIKTFPFNYINTKK
ncbi:MAG: hypothetical protein FWD71_06895 [Oscillospiraceae bacterium]|nr:hypothetical protein [Oscillospiraceae bacterium]